MELLFWSYERKSTDTRDKQQQSLETQENWNKREVTANNYHIVDRYVEAESATKKWHRPEFYRMIEDIHQGKINAIITYEVDRLARNFTENSIIQTLSQEGKILLIHTSSGKFYPNDILHLGMKSLFAVYESHAMKKKMKDGINSRVNNGFPLWTMKYGYNSVNKKLVINEEEACFVRKIFELREDGKTIKEIVDLVNELWFKSRDRVSREWVTKKWKGASNGKIERILKNPVYIGMFYYDGELYTWEHEWIIDEEVFRKLNKNNKRMPRRSDITPLKWKVLYNWEPLTVSEIKNRHGSKYVYFHKHSEKKGDKVWYNQNKIIKMFDKNIWNYVLPEKYREEFLGYIQETYKSELKDSQNVRKRINKTHTETLSELEGLTTMRAWWELSKEEFIPRKNKLIEKLHKIESQQKNLTNSDNNLAIRASETVEPLVNLLWRWAEWSTDQKLEWINNMSVELNLDTKKRLTVEEIPVMKAFRKVNNNKWWS